MIVAPTIETNLLTQNSYSRPGIPMLDIRGIVIYNNHRIIEDFEKKKDYCVCNMGYHIDQYIERVNHNNMSVNRYASPHYVVSARGIIWNLIPDNEMAYHSYTKTLPENIANRFNTTDPNNCMICIEVCSKTANANTYANTVHLISYLLEKYDLTVSDILREGDIRGNHKPESLYKAGNMERLRNDVRKYTLRSVLYNQIVDPATDIKNRKSRKSINSNNETVTKEVC